MSNPVSGVAQAQPQPVEQPATPPPKTAASKTQQTPTDTVQVSTAAKAILQEVQETHAQTVKEANSGDGQAKRLLAKEAAVTYQPKK